MTQPLAYGTISNTATVTQANMETYLEGFNSFFKELIGGSQSGSAIQLTASPGSITYADNVCTYIVDTVGGSASTGTLQAISTTANTRDGMVIGIQCASNARVITLSNGSGGAGQILTKDGNPLVLSDTRQWVFLRYTLATTSWNVLDNDETFRINQLMGGANATILTNSGTAGNITPTAAIHQVTTSTGSGSQTIANALLTSISTIGRVVLFTASNTPTAIPQFLHMNGGAGQFQMADSQTFSIDSVGKGIVFQLRSVASVLTWVEVYRFGTLPAPGVGTAGQYAVSNTNGEWVVLTPPSTSPGYVEVLDTSANGTQGSRWQPSDPGQPGGRLTVSSGTPVYVSPTAGGYATVYYTPYKSQYIPQWNATSGCWIPTLFPQLSLSLSGLTASTFYYLYVGSATIGTPSLSASTTVPSMQNGALCQTGAPANLYVGTMFVGSLNTTYVYDGSLTYGAAGLHVRNFYNRVPIKLVCTVNVTSYTYASSTVRIMDNGAIECNMVTHCSAAGRDYAIARVTAVWKTGTANDSPYFGVGLGSTTPVNVGQLGGLVFPSSSLALTTSNYIADVTVDLSGSLAIGYNQILALEAMPAGTVTIYGTDSTTGTASGISVDTDF